MPPMMTLVQTSCPQQNLREHVRSLQTSKKTCITSDYTELSSSGFNMKFIIPINVILSLFCNIVERY